MEYSIVVVPPGGGEVDYEIMVRGAHHIPRADEYLLVNERPEAPNEGVYAAFKVRYSTTIVDTQGQKAGWTSLTGVTVEAEPIFHYAQTESHRKLCERYGVSESYPESGY